MNLIFSKSSLLAAQEIEKDYKLRRKDIDKKIIDFFKASLDYKNGVKIIDSLGKNLIKNLNKTKNEIDYQNSLREILMKHLKNNKPPCIFHIVTGRDHFLEHISLNFEQVFRDAGLLIPIDLSDKSKKVRIWWDELDKFVRKIEKESNLEAGRIGEEKTMKYEKKKLKKLNINKEPKWDGYDNTYLGYDIQSWNENDVKIFIEVKTSQKSDGVFYFSRNQWNTSISLKDSFFIHLWIKNEKKPRIITTKELHSDQYEIKDASNAKWDKIKITPLSFN
jgi:hypothetical protein